MTTEILSEEKIKKLKQALNIIIKRIVLGKLNYSRAIKLMVDISRGDISFTINRKQEEELQHLMGLTGHKTIQDLTNNALVLYMAAAEAILQHEKIGLMNAIGTDFRPLLTPGLNRLTKDIEGVD